MVRELWQTRDAIAIDSDIAPGRILPDAALVDLALRSPKTDADISEIAVGRASRSVRRYQREWLAAMQRARQLPDAELPALTVPSDGPPPARAWADRDPWLPSVLVHARAALGEFAQDHNIPVENLISPDFLRRMLWMPPAEPSLESISAALLKLGARAWQVEIAGPIVQAAINLPATVGLPAKFTDG